MTGHEMEKCTAARGEDDVPHAFVHFESKGDVIFAGLTETTRDGDAIFHRLACALHLPSERGAMRKYASR